MRLLDILFLARQIGVSIAFSIDAAADGCVAFHDKTSSTY
jgi:hypothetical protein